MPRDSSCQTPKRLSICFHLPHNVSWRGLPICLSGLGRRRGSSQVFISQLESRIRNCLCLAALSASPWRTPGHGFLSLAVCSWSRLPDETTSPKSSRSGYQDFRLFIKQALLHHMHSHQQDFVCEIQEVIGCRIAENHPPYAAVPWPFVSWTSTRIFLGLSICLFSFLK